MTKDEALDLALEALEYIHEGANNQGPHTGISWRCVAVKAEPAITAIKQARALDKMAENARELGLDYEPVGLIARLKHPEQHYEFTDPKKANAVLMSLCQEAADALAAQQEHEPENEPHVSLASVQEPVAWVCYGAPGKRDIDFEEADIDGLPIGTLLYTTPPAQTAPDNQRALQMAFRQWESWKQYALELQEKLVKYEGGAPMVLNTTPPAPAVPDALTSADIQEHIEYVAGWNDCRQAMLEMMK